MFPFNAHVPAASCGLRSLSRRGMLALIVIVAGATETHADPLPGWNNGAARQAIIAFVEQVTDPDNDGYVVPSKRVATFDNDGTLWCEKPEYIQTMFLMNHARDYLKRNPEKSDLPGFRKIVAAGNDENPRLNKIEFSRVMLTTTTKMTQETYHDYVDTWLGKAQHPRFDRPYQSLTYQPMLELLRYLEANEFRVFICSGGGQDFMRACSERIYGIPSHHVIGSTVGFEYRVENGKSYLYRIGRIDTINLDEEKPVNIQRHIGVRPIFVFGNSDGDRDMMHYASTGSKPSLCLLLQHDDDAREYSYDKGAEKALKAAIDRGWQIVSMKKDFRTIFPTRSAFAVSDSEAPEQDSAD